MSSRYSLEIEVVGKDRASRPLGSIRTALSGILNVALGITAARIFDNIARSIYNMAAESINAVGQFQMMEIALQSLVAREFVQLSDGIQTIAEVFPQAQVAASELMDELAQFAILSPYTMEATQQTFKMAMAFGYGSEEAKKFTEAILNNAAGIGADSSMLERMAYNLAQVRLQGKVTKLDIRQLALAGFDLMAVLKYTGDEFGFLVEDEKDFNKAIAEGKITWADFTNSFAKYAEENFGGAAERMARSLVGLKSTFRDVFILTMPKLLGPAVEIVTALFNKVLDLFTVLRNSGILELWGSKLAGYVEKFVAPFTVLLDYVGDYADTLALVTDLTKDFSGESRAELAFMADDVAGMGTLWDRFREGIALAFGDDILAKVDRLASLISLLFAKDFKGFFKELGVPEWVITAMENLGIALTNIGIFWTENKDAIMTAIGGFVDRLGELFDLDFAGAGVDGASTTIVSLSEALIENGPLIVEKFDEILKKITDEWIPKGQEFMNNVKDVWIPAISDFGDKVVEKWIPALPAMLGMAVVMGLLSKVSWGLVSEGLRLVSANIMGFLAVNGVLPTIATVLTYLGGFAGPLLGVIAIFLALGAAVAGLVWAFTTNFWGIRDAVMSVVDIVVQALKPAWESISTMFTTQLLPALQGLWTAFQPIAQFLLGVLAGALGLIITLLGALVTGIVTGLTSAINFMMPFLTMMVEGITSIVNGVVAFFQGMWMVISGLFTGNFEKIRSGLASLASVGQSIVGGLIQAVLGQLGAFIYGVWGFLSRFFTGIVDYFRGIYNHITGEALPSLTATLHTNVLAIIDKIISTIKGKIGAMKDIGKDLLMGFVEGIKGAVGALISAVANAINSALAAARGLLKSKSPSEVWANLGTDTMEGYKLGILRNVPAVAAAASFATRTATQQAGLSQSISQQNNFNVSDELSAERVARRVVQMLAEAY